jgi:predicted AAA+ superfamily ATPase
LDRAIIDEIQRAPDLLLAVKKTVDEDYRPGRFLLTGSANVLTLPRIADSLAGRMETIQMLPLARAEIEGRTPTFLERRGSHPITFSGSERLCITAKLAADRQLGVKTRMPPERS